MASEMQLEKKNTSPTENGRIELPKEEEEEKKKKIKKLGGIKTLPFILANEICERFASTGSHANLISYLTQKMNLPLVKASNTLANFGGTASFTPLLGALIADSFAGRFITLILGTFIYELGLLSITISALLPKFKPPPCPTQQNCIEASTKQLLLLYLSLILSSLGSGGIRPCVVTFAADQLDMSKSKVESRSWNFFNWYYFTMAGASLAALTVVVYIQDYVGWGLGFGIPAIAMAVSIVVFVLGSPLYVKVKPGGSPLVRLAQVVVAAVKKRKVAAFPVDPCLLYENRELDAPISINGRLLHTNQFEWLDRAAVVTEDDRKDPAFPNLWKLTTVHRAEELKSILRMLPIWAVGILLVTSHSHVGSFTIVQARTMNRHLSKKGSFEIPPATLSIFTTFTVLIGLILYERLFVPLARRVTKRPSGITCLQRMGIGLVINILATVVSALVEIKRKRVAARHGLLDKPAAVLPMSVFWLVPQFCLHGLAEVFMSVGHLEFLYDQSPESIRSTAAALYWMATSVGNYLGTFVVSMVHKYSGKNGKENWLPDRNLNRGKLDYFYWLMSGIQVVNLVYFVVCAWFYKYKPLEEVVDGGDHCGLELAGDGIGKTDQIQTEVMNGKSSA